LWGFNNPPVPTIAEALAHGEQALFVGRSAELRQFERWLGDNPILPELLELTGPGGMGKTTLLTAFRRVAEQRGRPVVEVDLRGLSEDPCRLLWLLGSGDAETVAEQLNARRPLVLLDTLEEARDVQRVLADDLLPRLDTSVKSSSPAASV
jgi:predicted AAA+ superfamily ATPase